MLLDGSAGKPSEQQAIPNLTLRLESFKIINDLRSRVQKECGTVVSCSDITALAARDAVYLVNNPTFIHMHFSLFSFLFSFLVEGPNSLHLYALLYTHSNIYTLRISNHRQME